METGPHGQHGPHAAGPVGLELAPKPEAVTLLLRQTVARIAQEMQHKHKHALAHVQSVIYFVYMSI